MEKVFDFPRETMYHPRGLVVDGFSERTNWLGNRTMPQPVVSSVSLDVQPSEIKFFEIAPSPDGDKYVFLGNTASGGFVYGGSLQTSSVPYVAGCATIAFQYTNGDLRKAKPVRIILGLRENGTLTATLVDAVGHYQNIRQPPRPLVENISPPYTPTPADVEAYLAVVALEKPSSSVGNFVRSTPSNLLRVFYNPILGSTYNIRILEPNGQHNNYRYNFLLILGDSAFLVAQRNGSTGAYNDFTISVPKTDNLFTSAVEFRMVNDGSEYFSNDPAKRFLGMAAVADRVVYWDATQVYISDKNDPFVFGAEEGFEPQEGAGGIVKLGGVRWVAQAGSTLLAFTDRAVYRIVEVSQGLWTAIRTNLPTASEPVFWNNVYRRAISGVSAFAEIVGEGDVNLFGSRFSLLPVRSFGGGADFGGAVDNDGIPYVWQGENIYPISAGLIPRPVLYATFHNGKVYFLSSNGSSLLVYTIDPLQYDTSSVPKLTRWRYIKTYPVEVALSTFYIRLYGVASAPVQIIVRDADGIATVSYSTTIRSGHNKIQLPRRLRASAFDMEVVIGSPFGEGDYEADISAQVFFLERFGGQRR